jgi:hypothetical protein
VSGESSQLRENVGSSAAPAESIRQFVAVAREVQGLPYVWPGSPEASAAREQGFGTCASKHALLAEELEKLRLRSLPLLVIGPLAPKIWPDLCHEAAGLVEVHECLTVLTPWSGPLLVDVTWPAAAVEAGLPGLDRDWDGLRDGGCAIEPIQAAFAVERRDIRTWKLALRHRRTSPADFTRRESVLSEIAARVHAITAAG